MGFRPFVYRLATRYGLGGLVRNDAGGVIIEVEGEAPALEAFERELRQSGPRPAEILQVSSESPQSAGPLGKFRIEESLLSSESAPLVSPDLATCEACLRETLSGGDRRLGYAFTSCAECGPRFTMARSVPYDRERTSMGDFPFCPACRSEYQDPQDRRHHAEGSACPDCGPRLRLEGRDVEARDPIREAARRLASGGIVAVKGLGGFHLVCLADSEKAVAGLRTRKGRDEKPFAVMVPDLAAARRLCRISAEEETLLASRERPIVLLRRLPDGAVAGAVAPGNPLLGVMLPYTPLHHLLLREVGGTPLVVTSGNSSDLPIAQENDEALRSLGTIADLFLLHDREIQSRADDSVVRLVERETLVFRRSRGYAPAPLPLPLKLGKRTLALGGALKATFALGRGSEAILSHHLGELGAYATYQAYVQSIAHYENLFRFSPEALVHDLHPDYPSTGYALERARREGLEVFRVQHHHAHMASCMAENGLEGPVIGVTFDGTGYGTDGAIWGGEFLTGDYRAFRRAAHLDDVPMPGGEAAIREPWRMAAAYLFHAGMDLEPLRGRIEERNLDVVRQLLTRRVNAPRTSSCGRLFDGISSLLALRDRVSYEGQAAFELEWLARESSAAGCYPVELTGAGEIRVAPLISALMADLRRGIPRPDIARRFHSTVVDIIRKTCGRLREETGLDRVVLSGGVFMNELLLAEAPAALRREGFRVYRHRLVPPNDGGLSLGQLAVVAAGGGR